MRQTELFHFIDTLKSINTDVKVILTVSPVPLIATYENQHVLTSTTYSKSVLRVAAQEACENYPSVDYFPSFEIITGSPTGGMYFEPDMRQVNPAGVAHAMRCFINADTTPQSPSLPKSSRESDLDYRSAADILCDEEEIQKSFSRV